MTTHTYQDILNIAYWIISTAQDSNTYPEVLMRTFVNKAQNDICYGNIMNLSTQQRLEKQSLTFLEGNTVMGVRSYTVLSQDTSVWATTIYCANNLSDAGTIWINGNIITYTGRTTTTLTGCSWVLYPWTSGTRVNPIYSLPTDFGQLTRIFWTLTTGNIRRQLKPIDSRDILNPTLSGYAQTYFNASYGDIYSGDWYYSLLRAQYIFPMILGSTTSIPLSIEYQKKPTQLVNTTDLLTVPDEYSLNTIPYLAVAEMMANRGEMDEAIKLNNFAFGNVQSMYQFYVSQRSELQYNQRVGSIYDWYLNI